MMKILDRISRIIYFSLTTSSIIIVSGSQVFAQFNPIQSTFSQLTIDNAGLLRSAIETNIPPDAQGMFGGLKKISCQVGQTPSSCIPMGFFDTAFGIGNLTPQTAATAVGKTLDPNGNFTQHFPWLTQINVGAALQANPSLKNLLPNSAFGKFGILKSSVLKQPFGSVVNLNTAKLSQVPSMANTPLNKFQGFQKLTVNQIPNIGKIPFSQMVTIPAGVAVLKMDVARNREKNIEHMVMTGSEEQRNAKCDTNCDYIEVLPVIALPYLKGGKLISGDSLQVNGGKGLLKWVNGGKEPTGIHFSGMKFILRNVKAKQGTATVNLNFRACYYFFGEHCTPYFIGFPLWELNEKNNTIPLITTDASVKRIIRVNH
jgi:hypothetical protein